MLYFTGFVMKSISSEDSSQLKSPFRRQEPRDRVILKAFLTRSAFTSDRGLLEGRFLSSPSVD